MKFEWDSEKAELNLKKHGVSMEDGLEVFEDPLELSKFDSSHSEAEQRFIIIGNSSRGILHVVYTVRNDNVIRLISVRGATGPEKDEYYEE